MGPKNKKVRKQKSVNRKRTTSIIIRNSLKPNPKDENSYLFHLGCVTKAIREGAFLLIDEFNRADMNKAFGN